jgi:hypothetical protein
VYVAWSMPVLGHATPAATLPHPASKPPRDDSKPHGAPHAPKPTCELRPGVSQVALAYTTTGATGTPHAGKQLQHERVERYDVGSGEVPAARLVGLS